MISTYAAAIVLLTSWTKARAGRWQTISALCGFKLSKNFVVLVFEIAHSKLKTSHSRLFRSLVVHVSEIALVISKFMGTDFIFVIECILFERTIVQFETILDDLDLSMMRLEFEIALYLLVRVVELFVRLGI